MKLPTSVARLVALAALVWMHTGCTKEEARTVLDIARFTVDQLACMGAEIELGSTSPAAVAFACGPGLDGYLQGIEKFILSQRKAKMLVAAKRAGMATPDAKP